MMKKLPVLMLAGLLACGMLSACNGGQEPEPQTPPEEPHVHTFAEAWSSDETGHWHAATCGHDSEVSGKSEHTMSEGKCSVCGYRAPVVLTKDTDFAALVSEKVTEAEWDAAFSDEGFSGCSGRYENEERIIDFSFDYIQNGDVTDMYAYIFEASYYIHWAGNLVKIHYWDEESDEGYDVEQDVSSYSPEEIAAMKFEMSFRCYTTFDFSGYYQKFNYDEAKGAYVFEGKLDLEYSPAASSFSADSPEVMIPDAKVEVKFAGGKVAYVRVCGTKLDTSEYLEEQDTSKYLEESYCFFDYDEPKVVFPENAQPMA